MIKELPPSRAAQAREVGVKFLYGLWFLVMALAISVMVGTFGYGLGLIIKVLRA